jgi:hypothetical protein
MPQQKESRVLDEAERTDDTATEVPTIQRYAISSYGADYPIDSIYKRMTSAPEDEQADIYVPDFQRGYVWNKPQADKFIESLLLGLPIPGIFLSRDDHTQKLFIIDGSQRLRTLKFFVDGIFQSREFTLNKVHPDFAGKSYKTLIPEDRRRFDDTIIHATIVKQDLPEKDNTSIYYLFERINTGGTPAQPQEVRRSIYGGPFNKLLSALDDVPSWRAVFGPKSKRFKDQELILRFLALYFESESYGSRIRTLKDLLTHFMASNRSLPDGGEKFVDAFVPAIDYVAEALGRRAFRTKGALNAAIFDAVMVALARRLRHGPISSAEDFVTAYGSLLANEDFMDAATTGTSQPANVATRLRLAEATIGRLR